MVRRRLAMERLDIQGQIKQVEILQEYDRFVILVDGEVYKKVDTYEDMRSILKELTKDD